MPVPDDVQAFFRTIEISREVEEKLKIHKAGQAKLYDAKLLEVRGWLVKLARDLQQPDKLVSVPEYLQSLQRAVFAYGGYRIVFKPFLDSAMVIAQPDDQQVGGEHLQVDQVTEDWVRKTTLNLLLRHLKADNLVSHG
jgi:hypothetical protein